MGSELLGDVSRLVTRATTDRVVSKCEGDEIGKAIAARAGTAPDAKAIEPHLRAALEKLTTSTFEPGAMKSIAAAVEVATAGRATCTKWVGRPSIPGGTS